MIIITDFTVAKSEIFKTRFLESAPKSSAYSPNINDIGVLCVFRIMLGEKSLSSVELGKTNKSMSKISYYSKRFPNFPLIIDYLGNVFLGGNQNWYRLNRHYTKSIGGCGPTAGANTIASLVWQYPDFAGHLGASCWNVYKIATQCEYLRLMETIYEIIPPLEISFLGIKKEFDHSKGIGKLIPPTLGYFSSNRYRKKIAIFAKTHGLALESKKLWGIPKDTAALSTFLKIPISFLNTVQPINFYHPDGTFAQKSSLHWVTIIKIREDRLHISSWGQEFFIRPSEIRRSLFQRILNKLNRLSLFRLITKQKAN